MAVRRSNKVEEAPDEVRHKVVALRATVLEPSGEPFEMDTVEAMDLFKLSDARALRGWHKQGMPFRRVDRREVRYGRDAVIWHRVREYLKAVGRWRGNTELDMGRALRIEMYLQSTDRICREPMVLVPLSHDHPLREQMLRMACEGLPARPIGKVRPPTDAELDAWEPEAPLDAS